MLPSSVALYHLSSLSIPGFLFLRPSVFFSPSIHPSPSPCFYPSFSLPFPLPPFSISLPFLSPPSVSRLPLSCPDSPCRCGIVIITASAIEEGAVGVLVGGRCQGDMGGGCHGNKETLRDRDGGIGKGWTGCDSQWGRRVKIETLWQDPPPSFSSPPPHLPPHPSTLLSLSLCPAPWATSCSILSLSLSVSSISSWCSTICDLQKEDLQWPLWFFACAESCKSIRFNLSRWQLFLNIWLVILFSCFWTLFVFLVSHSVSLWSSLLVARLPKF